MTYDTTTTDGLLVRNGPRDESSEATESGLTVSPVSITQQKCDPPYESSSRGEHQSTNHTRNEANENVSMSSSTQLGLSQLTESTSTQQPLESDASETRRNSTNENNNTIGLPPTSRIIGSDSSATDPIQVEEEEVAICYNPVLDNEIRTRLDKLNALSDLINSLELRFDQANMLFRETLKCSTDRLSTIAKTLGSKSIQHGRIYQEAKLSVEKTQTDCQRACVQFEKANNDHQSAKEAIRDAEIRLKEMSCDTVDNSKFARVCSSGIEFNDLGRLSLDGDDDDDCDYDVGSKQECSDSPKLSCDNRPRGDISGPMRAASTSDANVCLHENCETKSSPTTDRGNAKQNAQNEGNASNHAMPSHDETKILNAAKLSEELNHAINRLIAAEKKRRQSEKLHMDQANKLMMAQENLIKLEREYGTSIKRSQVYFDEARRFNVRLNSVKSDIARISEEIIAAKQAYAKTLQELERFSENLHLNTNHLTSSSEQSGSSRQPSESGYTRASQN